MNKGKEPILRIPETIREDTLSYRSKIKEFLDESHEFEKIGDYNALTLYKYLRNEKGLMFEVLGNNPPRINYVKISPTKYRITVNEAKEPYELIFKTVFHNNWQARSDNMLFSKNDTAYSYANSWKINKTGSYFVDVIFKVWPWE